MVLRDAGRALVAVLALLTSVPSGAEDVAPWDRVLAAHARDGGIDYRGLHDDTARMADLRAFVASAGTMPESAPLAEWLNAYNAIVVLEVATRYPIASVRDVPGFFDRIVHRVAGRDRTLDAIENDVIRPRFHDARVHFALVCGASSCPALPNRAFRTATLDATLTRLARAVVADPRQVEVRAGRLRLSEIFFWFEGDFRRDAGSVLAFLRRYDATGRLAPLANDVPLERIPYRWTLNDRPR